MLSMAAPLVLGLLGNRVRSGGLNPAGLATLLMGERDQIMRAAPAGLGAIPGFASILGLKDVGGDTDIAAAAPRVSAPGTPRWLWPALAALALVAVLWGLSRARRPAAVDETVGAVKGAVSDVRDTVVAAAGNVRFHCGDQRISVSRVEDRTVLNTDAGTFDLRPVQSASGAKYEAFTDASTTFWNKGDRGTLTIRGKSYPECTRDR
jgi:membrane-bound inhibitor of C-type lysozyme